MLGQTTAQPLLQLQPACVLISPKLGASSSCLHRHRPKLCRSNSPKTSRALDRRARIPCWYSKYSFRCGSKGAKYPYLCCISTRKDFIRTYEQYVELMKHTHTHKFESHTHTYTVKHPFTRKSVYNCSLSSRNVILFFSHFQPNKTVKHTPTNTQFDGTHPDSQYQETTRKRC